MSLQENIQHITQQLQDKNITLIAVTKTKPISLLSETYELGLRTFGENKVQEMVEKYEALPKDIAWHLIGHLQTNKVKYITPFVSMIHSIDSLKLLKEVNKSAQKHERMIDCLLQVFIATEETKFGLSEEELFELLENEELKRLNFIRIKGLMGMATNTDDMAQIRKEFRQLKSLFDKCKSKYNGQNIDFQEISMGMSHDFQIAIEEGSTMVRVGSLLFGSR